MLMAMQPTLLTTRQVSPNLSKALQDAGCCVAFSAAKADKVNPGINSPLTNPWLDLTANANDATLIACAATGSDGYTTLSGVPYFKPDGTDTYATLVNTSSMDILGTGNIAIAGVFVTGATLKDSAIIYKGSYATAIQYQLAVRADGSMLSTLGSTSITLVSAGTILPNTKYVFQMIRESGVLALVLNGSGVYSNANTTSITTRPYVRMFARSADSGGTAHEWYSNMYHGTLAVFAGTNCTNATVSKAMRVLNRGYV